MYKRFEVLRAVLMKILSSEMSHLSSIQWHVVTIVSEECAACMLRVEE
jgi:hypothetical protein